MDLDKEFEKLDHLVGLTTTTQNREDMQNVIAALDEIKQNNESWKLAVYGFFNVKCNNLLTRFHCITILTEFLDGRHHLLSNEEKGEINNLILQWVAEHPEDDDFFLTKKISQLFVIQVRINYPNVLKNSWDDLLSVVKLTIENESLKGLSFLAETLESLDYQISARDENRSEFEYERNNLILNTMTESGIINQIFELIYQSISELKDSQNVELVKSCLKSFTLHIHWIEFSLVNNENFYQLLFGLLSYQQYREEIIRLFIEIIIKPIDYQTKLQLIEQLELVSFLEKNAKTNENEIEENDLKYFSLLSRLSGALGSEYLITLDEIGYKIYKSQKKKTSTNSSSSSSSVSTSSWNEVWIRFTSLLTLIFQQSVVSDDSLIDELIPFFHRLIKHFSKKIFHKNLNKEEIEIIQNLLLVVSTKIKYTDDYDFYDQDEYEQNFDRIRNELISIFRQVSRDCESIVNEHVFNILDNLFSLLNQSNNLHFSDIECPLALFLEILYPKPTEELINKNGDFRKVFQQILQNETITRSGNYSISHKLFWIIARYTRGFKRVPELIPSALECFLDERGVKSSDMKVRSECCHLFLRFTEDLKFQLTRYTNEIIMEIQPLLEIEIPTINNNSNNNNNNNNNNDNNNNDENDVNKLINSQLPLFQALSEILSSRNFILMGSNFQNDNNQENNSLFQKKPNNHEIMLTPKDIGITDIGKAINEQKELISLILTPVFETMKKLFEYQTNGEFLDNRYSVTFSECLRALISFLKGFFSIQTESESEIHKFIIEKTAEEIIKAIEIVPNYEIVRQRIVSYCYCVAKVIQSDSIPIFMNIFSKMYETSTNSKDFEDLTRLLIKYIESFSEQMCDLLDEVLNDIFQKIFKILETDEQNCQKGSEYWREIVELKNSFCLLLCTFIQKCPNLLISENNAQYLQDTLNMVITIIKENLEQSQLLFTAFQFFRMAISTWGGKLDGFLDFVYDNTVNIMFQIPLLPEFDPRSYEGEKVLSEINRIQRELIKLNGQNYLKFLIGQTLPLLISSQIIPEQAKDVFVSYVEFLNSGEKIELHVAYRNWRKLFESLRSYVK
ncbi:exportin-t [Anaeramoeba flamelloides]|uniref:Exportin-T n=1 Tax=Anaeramoeba flamelloides TaxID=1746091 RepID=A0ABQ8YXA0_9EUKA|nr:exportin-t [Anaeramoeba flamelloides]